jgi:hypothetical protein
VTPRTVPRTGHTSRLVPVGDTTPAAGDAVSDISDVVGLGSQPSQRGPGSVVGPQEGSREQLGHLLGSAAAGAAAAGAGTGGRAGAGAAGGGGVGGSAGDAGHPLYGGGVTPESVPAGGGKGGGKGEGKRKHAGAGGGSGRKGGAAGGGEEGPSKQRRIDSIFSKRPLASQQD